MQWFGHDSPRASRSAFWSSPKAAHGTRGRDGRRRECHSPSPCPSPSPRIARAKPRQQGRESPRASLLPTHASCHLAPRSGWLAWTVDTTEPTRSWTPGRECVAVDSICIFTIAPRQYGSAADQGECRSRDELPEGRSPESPGPSAVQIVLTVPSCGGPHNNPRA